jgi:hypothetical protein
MIFGQGEEGNEKKKKKRKRKGKIINCLLKGKTCKYENGI